MEWIAIIVALSILLGYLLCFYTGKRYQKQQVYEPKKELAEKEKSQYDFDPEKTFNKNYTNEGLYIARRYNSKLEKRDTNAREKQ